MFDFLKKKNSLGELQNDINKFKGSMGQNQQQNNLDNPIGQNQQQYKSNNSNDPMHNPMTQEGPLSSNQEGLGFSQQSNSTGDQFDPYNASHFQQPVQEETPMQNSFEQQSNLNNSNQKSIADTHDHNKHNQEVILKSLDVLNSKLDTIRVSIESLNQRLVNLERIAAAEEQRQKGTW